jgi:hypothetical protein
MKEINQVNYISVGKTVGIYVYINREKQLFTLESELRELIAQKIEGEICTEIHASADLAQACMDQRYAFTTAAKIARGTSL